MAVQWFSTGSQISTTNKTDCHHITEILLIILKQITVAVNSELTVLINVQVCYITQYSHSFCLQSSRHCVNYIAKNFITQQIARNIYRHIDKCEKVMSWDKKLTVFSIVTLQNRLTLNCFGKFFWQLYHGEKKLFSMRWQGPLCTMPTRSQKQKFADGHIALLGHNILIPSQPVFGLSPECCVLSGETKRKEEIRIDLN